MHLISRSQGYHGTHGLGTSIGGIAANRVDVGPLDPHASQVPHDSLEALEAEIERVGADRVAAVFVEPVIGAGGVHPPVPGYIEGVDALCKRTGVLHVVDAVIAGFGRLGEWFGPERWGIRPDMITFAKGVTSGYLPLGGVIVNGDIAAPFWDEENAPWFRHGPTYSGHPTCCAVALANLDIIEREGLLARALEIEGELTAALSRFASHALVGEVRSGTGALAAVALSGEVLALDAKAPMKVFGQARERGVLVRPLGDGVALSPALIITREEIDTAASAIGEALDAVASELGRRGRGLAANFNCALRRGCELPRRLARAGCADVGGRIVQPQVTTPPPPTPEPFSHPAAVDVRRANRERARSPTPAPRSADRHRGRRAAAGHPPAPSPRRTAPRRAPASPARRATARPGRHRRRPRPRRRS